MILTEAEDLESTGEEASIGRDGKGIIISYWNVVNELSVDRFLNFRSPLS